ncbi:hypothetical protein THAOC_09439, partial [Thalassiosira oceanica]
GAARRAASRSLMVHWCVECVGYCTAASAPGPVGRGWPCMREGKVRGRFREVVPGLRKKRDLLASWFSRRSAVRGAASLMSA